MSLAMTHAERLARGHLQYRKKPGKPDFGLLRIAEIKKVVRRRHGAVLPEVDDADIYFRAMARTVQATFMNPADVKSYLEDWIGKVAPWADATACADGLVVDDSDCPRQPHYTARQLADWLRLTYAERTAWGITTISAHDKTPDELRELKPIRERERKRDKRRQAGCRPQAESIARAKPWEAAGFKTRSGWSRAEKRKKLSAEHVSALPSIDAEQVSAPPVSEGGRGSAEMCAEQISSGPIFNRRELDSSDRDIGHAEVCVRPAWLEASSEERAARLAAALAHYRQYSLAPHDTERVAAKFSIPLSSAARLFSQVERERQHAA